MELVNKITLPLKYSHESQEYLLKVYGDFWDEIPSNLVLKDFSKKSLQKLNFDGGYVAIYENKITNETCVFKSHCDLFSLFYFVRDNELYISNDYNSLLKYFSKVTWNLQAVSDYFEDEWNNILKQERTPFKEISNLESWTCLVFSSKSNKTKIRNWKKLNRKIIFTEKNLDDFKKHFFSILDYYLDKIHTDNEKVGISCSAGIDTNTLAAEYSKLYPNSNTIFFTSKFDDVADESKIASYMQPVLSGKLNYIPIKMVSNDFIDTLHNYMKKNLPPRFFNEINEEDFNKNLAAENIDVPVLNGMGADGTFGEFGGEYLFYCRDLLKKFKLKKAFNVFTAVKVSFPYRDISYTTDEIKNEFKGFYRDYYKILLKTPLRYLKKLLRYFIYGTSKRENKYIKCELPEQFSSERKNFLTAGYYASFDGADRAVNKTYSNLKIKGYFPYIGYKFKELSAHCSPYIFMNKVNKSCLRYAVNDLLPTEILNNKIKTGAPGVSLKKVIFGTEQTKNFIKLQRYLQEHNSCLVDNIKLLNTLNFGVFEQKEFLALCLLMYENIIKQDFNIEIGL